MAITLVDLAAKTGPNPGGIVNLYVAKAADVSVIPEAVNGVITTDLTVTGDGFKKFEFAPDTCKLSHPTVGEPGSKSFQELIDCIIDGDDERLAMFESMINGRFICIVDAASAGMRVVGTKRAPLLLEQANYDGGAAQGDRNATTFQFVGRSGHMSLRYTGAIPAVGGVV
jgi:hypothetical protein